MVAKSTVCGLEAESLNIAKEHLKKLNFSAVSLQIKKHFYVTVEHKRKNILTVKYAYKYNCLIIHACVCMANKNKNVKITLQNRYIKVRFAIQIPTQKRTKSYDK